MSLAPPHSLLLPSCLWMGGICGVKPKRVKAQNIQYPGWAKKCRGGFLTGFWSGNTVSKSQTKPDQTPSPPLLSGLNHQSLHGGEIHSVEVKPCSPNTFDVLVLETFFWFHRWHFLQTDTNLELWWNQTLLWWLCSLRSLNSVKLSGSTCSLHLSHLFKSQRLC